MARKILTGDKELERTLKRLEDKVADRVAKSALGSGLTVMAKAIKQSAPVGNTGALKASVGKRNLRNRRKNIHEAKVGINVGKVSKKQKAEGTARAPHSHLVGLGTGPRTRKALGGKFAFIRNPTAQQLSAGSMPKNPFVKEAVRSAMGSVSVKMKSQAAKTLSREAARAARK